MLLSLFIFFPLPCFFITLVCQNLNWRNSLLFCLFWLEFFTTLVAILFLELEALVGAIYLPSFSRFCSTISGLSLNTWSSISMVMPPVNKVYSSKVKSYSIGPDIKNIEEHIYTTFLLEECLHHILLASCERSKYNIGSLICKQMITDHYFFLW